MTEERCNGCLFYGSNLKLCYYDVEILSGQKIIEMSFCPWTGRREKNNKYNEIRKQKRLEAQAKEESDSNN